MRDSTLVFGVAAGVALVQILLVVLLPPLLDVYYYDAQAVHALLQGLDPYGLAYTGIPSWLATQEATNVFAYLPGVFLFLFPFGALADVRLGLVAADLVVGLAIYSIGGRRAKPAALAFLLLPFTLLFSTSYPNDTLVAMAFLGSAFVLWLRGRNRLASLLLGCALASSQFIWLLLPLFLFWEFRSSKLDEALVTLAATFAFSLPFVLWNPSAFFYDTVVFEFARAPRVVLSPAALGINVNPTLDGISLTLFGVAVPLLLRVALTLVALLAATMKSRDLSSIMLNSTWFMVVTIFVLPNVLSWWYLELPFQTFLIWYAATRAGRVTDANA